MPEDRLARARKTLPKGYQFGDGSVAGGAGLPTRPILDEPFDHIFSVELANGSEAVIAAAIAEMTASLSGGIFTAYARLERPQAVENYRFYGPVRYVRVFDPARRSIAHLLHVGLVGWVPTPPAWRAPHLNAADRIARYQREYETDRDPGDEA